MLQRAVRKYAPPFFVGAAGMRITAASGRRSEMSEWPRSKFSSVRRKAARKFGCRNRVIGPYGGFTSGMVGCGIPYTHTLRIYTPKNLAKFAAAGGKLMRAADRKPLWQKIPQEFFQ